LIRLGEDNILKNLIISPGDSEDRRFPSIISEGGLQFRPPEQGSICYIGPELAEFSSFDQTRHMSENVSVFLNRLQEVSIVNGRFDPTSPLVRVGSLPVYYHTLILESGLGVKFLCSLKVHPDGSDVWQRAEINSRVYLRAGSFFQDTTDSDWIRDST